MKRWLKRILISAVILSVVVWISLALLLQRWTAKPPPLPADTSVMQLKTEVRGEKIWLGKSWVTQREGLPVIFLKGSPFEMGFASSALLEKKIYTLENEFLAMVRGYVPQPWKLNLLKNYVIYRNRHLSDFVPLEYRQQIHGSVMGCADVHPELGNYYNRMLNYHAAHDVSYLLIDNPLVSRAGCTSFGAWGDATVDGHLVTGRNFDWEAAEVFSRDRIVILCEPDDGIPSISLSWAGMAGVVSGMNRAGVSVTINGAPSDLPGETATPVAMVARDVLQKAHNLTEALEIIRGAKVFVSTHWLVGSRADGKFVVVEKTPDVCQVRDAEKEILVSANHFQTDDLKSSERNTNYMSEATSVSRYNRMTELLQNLHKKIDAARAVEILRDRNLPDGEFVGNGHRASLNAFIATHATVMDLTAGIFWAASPPKQLGKFVAFDVNDFDRELPDRTVAADAILASGDFENFREAQKNLAEGQRALKNNDAAHALLAAEKAEALNPGFYQNAMLQGKALSKLGRADEAIKAFSTALAEQPAFLAEKAEIETGLREAQKTK